MDHPQVSSCPCLALFAAASLVVVGQDSAAEFVAKEIVHVVDRFLVAVAVLVFVLVVEEVAVAFD